MERAIRIDVWSDVVCPWCYIGKRRLEEGIAAFTDRDGIPPVEVIFRSFELMPDAPVDVEVDAATFLARRYGVSQAEARRMQQQVTEIAATVGLDYDFEQLVPTNSRRSHEALHLARSEGVQGPMKDRLLRAHFSEGRHVGREEELADLASDVGLDGDEVQRALRERTFLPAVRDDEQAARRAGVTGVPFAVVAGRYAISGAQPAEVFTRALLAVGQTRGDDPAA